MANPERKRPVSIRKESSSLKTEIGRAGKEMLHDILWKNLFQTTAEELFYFNNPAHPDDEKEIKRRKDVCKGANDLRKIEAKLIPSLGHNPDPADLIRRGIYQLIPDSQFKKWISMKPENQADAVTQKYAKYFFEI